MREIAREVIEMAAGGDMAAFEEIYKTFSSTVYTIALGVTHDRQDAEEAVQDVFVKVFKALKSFRFGSSFGTWIYRITMNTAINIRRSQARRRTSATVDYDEIKESIPDPRNAHEDRIEKSYAFENVDKILKNLSPEHRSCVVLREIEGLDYKEIADILKIPLNTVRSRLKRARESMVTYCREEGLLT